MPVNPNQQIIQGIVCSDCGEILESNVGNRIEMNDNIFCIDCYDNNIMQCPCCEEIYATSWGSGIRSLYGVHHIGFFTTEDGGETICENCVHFCPECSNAYEHQDNMNCCHNRDLRYYSYRPNSWKYWDVNAVGEVSYTVRALRYPSKLFMGIELEIEKMDNNIINDFLTLSCEPESGDPSFCYFKEDGSLSSNGAELVTMPATLDAFVKRFPFDALHQAREAGARSFYYSSCGFHIHVSRSSFSPSHMYKFIKFHMKNDNMCIVVAQRGHSGYATWDAHDTDNLRKDTKRLIERRVNTQRYAAINMGNADTIELRYFKGNILKEAVLKNVEFVDSVYEYTKQLSVASIWKDGYSWDSYIEYLVEHKDRYMNLYTYLTTVGTTVHDFNAHDVEEEF